MFRRLTLCVLSLLSFSSNAANVATLNQPAFIEADKSQLLLVDVRTKKEFQNGHIPGAVNLPLSTIEDDPSILNIAKNKSIVLYCRSGYRAGKAANVLQQNGYTNLSHLEGDFLAWQKARLPTEK
jgi:phage shock protein E